MDRRILVVGDAFYPKLGGGERVIAESSGALRRRGHAIWILAGTDDPDLPLRQEWDGLHIVRYRFSPRNTLSLNLGGILGAERLPTETTPLTMSHPSRKASSTSRSIGIKRYADANEGIGLVFLGLNSTHGSHWLRSHV